MPSRKRLRPCSRCAQLGAIWGLCRCSTAPKTTTCSTNAVLMSRSRTAAIVVSLWNAKVISEPYLENRWPIGKPCGCVRGLGLDVRTVQIIGPSFPGVVIQQQASKSRTRQAMTLYACWNYAGGAGRHRDRDSRVVPHSIFGGSQCRFRAFMCQGCASCNS